MTKRQRRGVTARRRLHMEATKGRRRGKARVPIALAVAATSLGLAPGAIAAQTGSGSTPSQSAAPAPYTAPLAWGNGPASQAAAQQGQTVITNPDAPPEVANPTPQSAGNLGMSVGGSYYEGVGGGATYVATTNGNALVLEGGIGFGPSVSIQAGQNVTVPSGPSLQASTTVSNSLPGGLGYRGTVSASEPLSALNPDTTSAGTLANDLSVSANAGLTVPGVNIPGLGGTNTLRGSVTTNPFDMSGNSDALGGQYSATRQFFNETDQTKLAVRVPIPLPDPVMTSQADSNGVSDVTIPNGDAPPAMYATRSVDSLGYPDGNGNTVTLNNDGSYTLHTPNSDVTTYGPFYSQWTGNDPSQQGTLTHQLIDPTTGQRTDTYTWSTNGSSPITQDSSGNVVQTLANGSTVSQAPSGVVTQTNTDGTTVSYDPSSGTITQTTPGLFGTGLFGTTTTYNSDGTVTQIGPTGTSTWDSSGQGISMVNGGDGFSVPTSAGPAPSAPSIPQGVSLPHGPNSPSAPTPAGQSTTNDSSGQSSTNGPSDTSNSAPAPTPSTNTSTPTPAPAPTDNSSNSTPAPAPTDNTPAPAPTDNTPTPAPVPTDSTPAPAPTDSTPAPAPTDSTPAPAPTDNTPAPAPAPTDSTPTPAPTDSTPTPAPTDNTPTPAPTDNTPTPAPTDNTPTPAPTDNTPTPAPTDNTPTATPTPAPTVSDPTDPTVTDPTTTDPTTTDPTTTDPTVTDPTTTGTTDPTITDTADPTVTDTADPTVADPSIDSGTGDLGSGGSGGDFGGGGDFAAESAD
jgi:hypothetical protein